MYAIDFDGFLMLMGYMLVRLIVPVLLMAILAKFLQAIAPQTP
jgi:hypothetical protein